MRVRPRLSSASLQIHRQITLGLPLHAGIMERRRPLPSCTIIFQESMLHRLIPTLGDVMESDPRHFVARYGKADTIIRTVHGHAGASTGIAQIAEIPNLGAGRRDLFSGGPACPVEACAQGQAGRKRPFNGGALFSGKEIRTRHSKAILARLIVRSKERFSTCRGKSPGLLLVFRSAFFRSTWRDHCRRRGLVC